MFFAGATVGADADDTMAVVSMANDSSHAAAFACSPGGGPFLVPPIELPRSFEPHVGGPRLDRCPASRSFDCDCDCGPEFLLEGDTVATIIPDGGPSAL